MTDTEITEGAVKLAAKAMGVPLPVEEIAKFAAFLASKLRGKGWGEAIQAGVDAAAAVKTEADAEASRRARLGETP